MTNFASKTIIIKNEKGLHARAGAKLIELSSNYNASLVLEKDGLRVEADSLMEILLLAAEKGSSINLHAKGPQSQELIDAVSALTDRLFDEAQ